MIFLLLYCAAVSVAQKQQSAQNCQISSNILDFAYKNGVGTGGNFYKSCNVRMASPERKGHFRILLMVICENGLLIGNHNLAL